MAKKAARDILDRYELDQIRQKLALVAQHQAVKNQAGFFIEALQEDWRDPVIEQDRQQQEKRKYSLTTGKVDSGHDRPANQLREGRDHVQAGHPILEVLPEGDTLFAAGLLEAGEGVAALTPVCAAGPGADVPFFHDVPQVGLAAVVVDR